MTKRAQPALPDDASRRALGLLGLAARAGAVVSGTEEVRRAVRKGRLVLVLIAQDASDNSRGKLIPLLRTQGVDFIERFDRATLGGAAGKAQLSALGVLRSSFATPLRTLLLTGPDKRAAEEG
jgi:ribosomal protein L7Ae-like RNA K-turn-binding protein